MLAACAARLADQKDLIWVDLGGGTGVSLEQGAHFPQSSLISPGAT